MVANLNRAMKAIKDEPSRIFDVKGLKRLHGVGDAIANVSRRCPVTSCAASQAFHTSHVS
jgi:hypothetical protein